MQLCRLLSLLVLVTGAALSALPAMAQTFPARAVRIIVPFGPGGAADSLPRLVGTKLAEIWGQPVVIENRTGAAGNIGMEAAARSAPDGYTLVSAPVGNLAVNPHLYPSFQLDVFKELSPITLVASVQNVLVVNASVPAATLAELIALAKQKPGGLSFASGGNEIGRASCRERV